MLNLLFWFMNLKALLSEGLPTEQLERKSQVVSEQVLQLQHSITYEGVSKSFRTESMTK
jgi:hypothetical protein